ncbi:MAG: T9SS type A sorting domain-containing protein [Bacteroidetes bacterium]|nr:T9SS type A sorting domain-containing protein [Bacteroidota bacterium]
MKTISIFFATLLLLSTCKNVNSQGQYVPANDISVSMFGSALKNPWVGGYNAPIFSEIDLNGDGIKDLFIFDKDGDRVTTYLNTGTPNTVSYVHAPEYKKKFPKTLHDWVLLKDFDCDGREDIFTYSYSGGMTVYRNDYSVQNGLKFNLAYTLVNSKYGPITANLYVSAVNLPALADVDYDGDLDVLTFPVSGSFVEYHKNKGKEYFNKCDTLVFEIEQSCFGNFGLSGQSNTGILNVGCRMAEPQPPVIDSALFQTLHSGSCMIALDIDGDIDYDILNGDILGNNLLLLFNNGTSGTASITAQDTAFPSYDTPVNMVTFPAPYYFDVNNDGNKDMVVAPCISGPAENFNNILYYKNLTNNSTNNFNYQQNRFLADEMIEVGSGANVTFVDIDSDGLKDIIVGNFGYYSAILPFESGLSYYRNTGTGTNPAFELQTIDFENFFSLPITGIDPTFGDVDSDNDLDLMLGQTDGTIIYYTNTAGPGIPPVYTLTQVQLTNNFGDSIDIGQAASPQLVDVNKDGKLDLIIGKRSSTISYYENTGTPFVPQFTLVTANFGGVNVNNAQSIYGYSNPVLYDSAGTYQLLVGSISGYIYQYNNIDGNLNGTFNLVDSMYYDIYEPDRSTVDVADLNGDGKNEILVGNYSGGITLYRWDNSSSVPEVNAPINSFNVYPNPTSGDLFIKFKSSAVIKRDIAIFDITGRLIENLTSTSNVIVFDAKNYATGVYHVRVIEGTGVKTEKFVVK